LKIPANLNWAQNDEAKNWIEPKDFAEVIGFLLSYAADSITGATISVKGKY